MTSLGNVHRATHARQSNDAALLLIACLDVLKLCKVNIPVDAKLPFLPNPIELSAVVLGAAVLADHTECLRLSTCLRCMALWTSSQSSLRATRAASDVMYVTPCPCPAVELVAWPGFAHLCFDTYPESLFKSKFKITSYVAKILQER